MKNSVKIFASVLFIILGNALIFPFEFWLVCIIAVWIPRLNEIYWFWLAELIAAVPTAVIFVFMRRLFNRVFKLDVRRIAAVLACALPSFVVSIIAFWLTLKAEVTGRSMDFGGTIVMFSAVPYTAVCIMMISAAFGIERAIEKRKERA